MRPVVLVVSRESLLYIRYVVDYIRAELERNAGAAFTYQVCDDLREYSPEPGSIVFVIGDTLRLRPHSRVSRYVFVNFSLLYRLVPRRLPSLRAYLWIRRKHRQLAQRLTAFDVVLDFHPVQTCLLEREFGASGVHFRSFFTDVVLPPVQQRRSDASAHLKWDVCLVGTTSARRTAVRGALEAAGVRVTPDRVDDLHAAIIDSRIVLNVHYARCDTLEAPRIVHALRAGACLVTETCVGLQHIAPPDCYVEVRYAAIVEAVRALLADAARMARLRENAATHMRERYGVAAAGDWRAIVAETRRLLT